MPNSTTIIISCAGRGTRLGMGLPKALIDVDGVPLIIRQLQMLKDYDDIRIVVGYQMEKVIETVLSYRRDILFVFNHNYMNTGTGASFMLGTAFARKYVVAIDGDVLVHPADLVTFIEYGGNCVCGTNPSTDNPVLMEAKEEDGKMIVTKFSREFGDYEWTGLMKISNNLLLGGLGHVYQLVEHLLPIDMLYIRSKEVDTPDDYDVMVRWVQNNYSSE